MLRKLVAEKDKLQAQSEAEERHLCAAKEAAEAEERKLIAETAKIAAEKTNKLALLEKQAELNRLDKDRVSEISYE